MHLLKVLRKNGGDLLFLGLSSIFGLSKLLLFRYIFDSIEFGNYALAIVYSQLLMYFMSPGADSGMIRVAIKFFVDDPSSFEYEFRKLFSVLLLVSTASSLLLVFIVLIFGLTDNFFYFFIIITAHSQILINVLSIRWRVLGFFKSMGVIHTLRIFIMSLPLYLAFLFNSPPHVNTILVFESLLGLAFALGIAMYFRTITFDIIFKNFKDFYYLSKIGFTISLGALIKSAVFSMERSIAKLLLVPLDFGLYSTLMIGFQVVFMSGSIVGQPVQRKVLILAEQGKFDLAKKSLLCVHSAIITLTLLALGFAWFLKLTVFETGFAVLSPIMLAGVLVGFAFYDNLVLAAAKGALYIRNLIQNLLVYCIIVGPIMYLFNSTWTLILQGYFLVSLMVTLVVSAYMSCKR